MRVLRPIVFVVGLASAFAAAALLLPHSPSELRALLPQAGVLAPALVLAAWMVLTPALFPGAVLAAATGLAFGAVGGAALACAGAVLGGLVAFTLARTVARGSAERLAARQPSLARLDDLLSRRGFAALLAVRLMPGVPVGGLHYAAGISPIRAPSFALAMGLGALLRTAPYALLGQGLASGSPTGIALAAASVAIGVISASLLVRRLRTAPTAA